MDSLWLEDRRAETKRDTFHFGLHWDCAMQGIKDPQEKYEYAKKLQKEFFTTVPIEEVEKYNPVNIEEQRVLNALKQDLTKH